MKKNPRELLDAFMGGLQDLGQTNKEHVNAFMGLLGAAYKPGAMDTKTKELISVSIGVFSRCEYCIVFHTYKALEAGANREEIIEAAMVAPVPSMPMVRWWWVGAPALMALRRFWLQILQVSWVSLI